TGNAGSVVKWQYCTDNFVLDFHDISNITTSQTYLNLTVTTSYRTLIQRGVCAPAYSSAATLTVRPLPTVTSVNGGGTYCTGAVVANVTASVTGTGPWSVSFTLNGVAQTPATGATSPISLGNATGVYVVTAVSDFYCSN